MKLWEQRFVHDKNLTIGKKVIAQLAVSYESDVVAQTAVCDEPDVIAQPAVSYESDVIAQPAVCDEPDLTAQAAVSYESDVVAQTAVCDDISHALVPQHSSHVINHT